MPCDDGGKTTHFTEYLRFFGFFLTMSNLIVSDEKCTLCEICVHSCPFDALRISAGEVHIGDECVLCGACVKKCPEDALSIESEVSEDVDVDTELWRGVWVVVEIDRIDGKNNIEKVSFELIGKGRELAESLQVELSAVVMGIQLDDVVKELSRYEVDKIYCVENQELAEFRSGIYSHVLSELVRDFRPEILLCGATADGRDFFPRTAALLHTGLTADCTGLSIDIERRILLQTRPAFGGNIMATIECPGYRPQMATVRPNVMPAPRPSFEKKKEDVDMVEWQPSAIALKSPVEFLNKLVADAESANISEADIIVAGGRGTGGEAGFAKLKRLAEAVGGMVGASRAAVDSGWAPYTAQVGQTGRVVQPKLYIACGISGAIQHLVGMRSAQTIVAINKDPRAPIFEVADFGFVGDMHKIVPRLTQEIDQ